MFSPCPLNTANWNTRIYTDIGTIVCVNAGAGYVHCTSADAPRQSKRLSGILNDPAAAGKVVCSVAVAVATETWWTEQLIVTHCESQKESWRLSADWEANRRSCCCGLQVGLCTAGFQETSGLELSGQRMCELGHTWRTPRKPGHDLIGDRGWVNDWADESLSRNLSATPTESHDGPWKRCN